MKDKKELIKLVSKMTIGVGVSTVTAAYFGLPVRNANMMRKLCVGFVGLIVCDMLCEKINSYADNMIDDLFDNFNKEVKTDAGKTEDGKSDNK